MLTRLKFNLLCQCHRDSVYRYAWGMVGNAADAEDITQEALIRLWDHLSRIEILSVRAWLLTATRNLCIDHIRRNKRRAESFVGDTGLLDNTSDEQRSSPAEAADDSMTRERAEAAIQALPEMQRTVFLLHEVEGMKYRQIADSLGIPVNTVKVYLLRARRSIHQELFSHEAVSGSTVQS